MDNYTYDDCLAQCLKHVKSYHTARKSNQWDYWEFQDIRDELGEALVYFNPLFAELRAAAEQAEIDRKHYFAERRKYWRDEAKKNKEPLGAADDNATIDAKPFFDKEVLANKEYYRARGLYERIDQVLNGISSRLKPLDKYDSHNQEHGKKISTGTRGYRGSI
jgi:hypothetical protein